MAGAITHLLVAEDAGEMAKAFHPRLGQILADHKAFMMLGAVSPDLPYLDLLSPDQKQWADRMHYERTNLLACQSAIRIGSSQLLERPEGKAQLAWLAGYIAHCVTDATVHPIVQAIVGPYHGNELEHRRCEMVQDSLIFTEVKKCNLRDSHYVEILRELASGDLGTHILDLWQWALCTVYGQAQRNPDTRAWFRFYRHLLHGAVDGDLVERLSRSVGAVHDLLYMSGEALRIARPDDVERFYVKARLPGPGDETDRFEARGFQFSIENILPVWAAIMEDATRAQHEVFAPEHGALVKELKNWNLDTGEEMDGNAHEVTYWPKYS